MMEVGKTLMSSDSPTWITTGGSILWGAMVLLIVGAFAPARAPSWVAPATAMALAIAVEAFRLVHAPALDAFRLTLPGALLLGGVFSGSDVLAYGIGIAAALPMHVACARDARRRAGAMGGSGSGAYVADRGGPGKVDGKSAALPILGAAASWTLPVVLAKPLTVAFGDTAGAYLFEATVLGATVLGVASCLALPVRSLPVRTAMAAVCGLATAPLVLVTLIVYACAVYGDCL